MMLRAFFLAACLTLISSGAWAQCYAGPSGSVCPAGTTGPSALTVTVTGTAAGTPATTANPVQGVTGGVPVPVQSGGYTASAQLAPTVTASAYTAGYSIGGLLTFTGLVRSTQATGLVQRAVAAFADTQTPTLDLILFSASPTSSTTTDHAAFSLAGADIAKVLGVIHVTDCSAAGTPTVCQAQQQAVPIVLPSNGASLYGVLVTRAAITPASTSDLTVTLGSLED